MGTFIKPSQFKAVIPNPNDTLCQQFKNFIEFVSLVYQAESWMFDDGGGLSADFQALLCSLPCAGGGTGTGTTTASTGSTTSGGGGNNTTTSTVPANVPGKIPSILGSHGFFSTDYSWYNSVVWNKPGDAVSYDIYRGTVDSFTDAGTVKIVSNRTPDLFSTPTAQFVAPFVIDNIDHIVFQETPPTPSILYYYWVVPRNGAGPGAVSDSCWAFAGGPAGYTAYSQTLRPGESLIVPAGVSTMRVVAKGCGGFGAGGSIALGGGGGGGGAVYIVTGIGVTTGQTLACLNAPNVVIGDSPYIPAAQGANGQDAPDVILKQAGTEVIRAYGGKGGKYGASQAGTGGIGGGGGVGGLSNNTDLYGGFGGRDANGIRGGEGGCLWGNIRCLPTHLTNPFTRQDVLGNALTNGDGGGGSCANQVQPNSPLATGGTGFEGCVVIQFGV